AMGQKGEQAIQQVMTPALELERQMFDLGPGLAKVSDDIEGSMQRAKNASQDWAKAWSQGASQYLGATNVMLRAGHDEAGAHEAARIALIAASGAQTEAIGTSSGLVVLYDTLGDKTQAWNKELASLGDQVVRTRQLYGAAFDPAALADPLKDAGAAARDARLPSSQLLVTLG